MMRALLLSPLLMVGACASLLGEAPPPPTVFVLEAGDVAATQGAPIDKVISVARPAGEGTVLGTELVWRTGDQVVFVADTQWSGEAQELLQAALVQTLSQQRRFRAAVSAGDAVADYQIRWTVQDFEVTESDMRARFGADVIVLASGRRVIATEHVATEAPVSERSASAAANALTRAAREGSARIALFAADAVAQEEARAAAEDSQQSGVDQ